MPTTVSAGRPAHIGRASEVRPQPKVGPERQPPGQPRHAFTTTAPSLVPANPPVPPSLDSRPPSSHGGLSKPTEGRNANSEYATRFKVSGLANRQRRATCVTDCGRLRIPSNTVWKSGTSAAGGVDHRLNEEPRTLSETILGSLATSRPTEAAVSAGKAERTARRVSKSTSSREYPPAARHRPASDLPEVCRAYVWLDGLDAGSWAVWRQRLLPSPRAAADQASRVRARLICLGPPIAQAHALGLTTTVPGAVRASATDSVVSPRESTLAVL
jgi:hypothetical protein